MPPTVPALEPDTLRAGTTWEWTRSFDDFPVADGWTLAYAIRGVGVLTWLPAWVTDDGTTWTITIPATATAALGAGLYEWAAVVSLVDEKYVAASGTVRVLANLETATAGARQRHAERMVLLIEAELERRMTGVEAGVESFTIGDRAVNMIATTELRKLLAQYRAELTELQRRRHGGTTSMKVQFQRPTGAARGGA